MMGCAGHAFRAAAGLLLVAWQGPVMSAAPITGSFEGSGRACYGRLVVTPAAIAWATPASRCKRSAYRLLDGGAAAAGASAHAVFHLKRAGRACRTPVIVLRQHAAASPDIGWEAIGYPSLAAFKADDDASALSCALVRLK